MSAQQPAVSLVVLNWRRESDTARCVESIRAQRTDLVVEVIIVDNESTPASRERLGALGGCVVVASTTNLGFSGGMNLGVDNASGEFVGILNNDLVLGATWLQEGVDLLRSDESIGIVGGKSYSWDDLNPLYCSANKAYTVAVVDTRHGMASLLEEEMPRCDVATLDGGNLLLSAKLWHRLGGFDDDYFAYAEDVDLCARCLALGHRLVYQPAMEVWHKRNVSSDSVRFRRAFWSRRNRLYNVAKHFPEATWRKVVLRDSLDDIWYGLGGRMGGLRHRAMLPRLAAEQRLGSVAAGLWGLSHLRRLVRKRRAVQAAGLYDEGYVGSLRNRNPL